MMQARYRATGNGREQSSRRASECGSGRPSRFPTASINFRTPRTIGAAVGPPPERAKGKGRLGRRSVANARPQFHRSIQSRPLGIVSGEIAGGSDG